MDTWTLPQSQIVIVNYEKFGRAPKNDQLVREILKRKFDMVILDEAHYIKNRASATTKHIMKLNKIPHRLVMTGTPAYNKAVDLFPLLRFLKPGMYTSYWAWLNKWFEFEKTWTPHGTVYTPVTIQKGLRYAFAKELSSIGIQRKRKDVMDWAIDPDIIDIPLPCTKTQIKYLDSLETLYKVEDVYCQGTLDRLTAHRQICDNPSILSNKLKDESPKTDWLINFIRDNPQKRLLVFGIFKQNLTKVEEAIHKHFKSKVTCAKITGDTHPKQRAALVEDYQSGKLNVLLLQIHACAAGLTLDTADTTVFLELYPPAADYLQAKDRMVPTKPELVKSQEIYRLYMKDTFDEVGVAMVDGNVSATDVIANYKKYLLRRYNE